MSYTPPYKRDSKGPAIMSHDRVHFTIPAKLLYKNSIRECIVETLGIPTAKAATMGRNEEDLHIVCRPSQFARFVILRHVKYKEPNNMACLNMRLVIPEPTTHIIDVSHKHNTAGASHATGEQKSTYMD